MIFLTVFSPSLWFNQDVIPDWQQAASNILVAVGNKHINDIMEEILSKFQPGLLPHFFVVQTLANLSDSNGKTIFTGTGTMEPHIGHTQQHTRKSEHLFTMDIFSIQVVVKCVNLLNLSKNGICRPKIFVCLVSCGLEFSKVFSFILWSSTTHTCCIVGPPKPLN